VPKPPLLGGSPLAFEAHTEDESEDSLSPRKRYRCEVSDMPSIPSLGVSSSFLATKLS
jgi:hypothetical protein